VKNILFSFAKKETLKAKIHHLSSLVATQKEDNFAHS
jgi:hypothetical protein